MAKERLDKLLSHEGFGSRKDIKKMFRSRTVLINGKQIFDSSIQVDADKDAIIIDGEKIDFHKNIYLMMNKPQHVVSSSKDGEHQTVFDLLDESLRTPYLIEKLHLVGRLDMDTEGLLLFTTDGELTHRLISPKSHISKTYFCGLEHAEPENRQTEIAKLFKDGIFVGPDDNEPGFKCQSAFIEWKNEKSALLTIYEGKYHQVRRMFGAVSQRVLELDRVKIGLLELDDTLERGEYRELTEKELNLIK